MTTNPPDFDGCNSECRKAGAHTLRWGGCEHAPAPEPTVSLSRVYTEADGHPSIGFDAYTVAELADLVTPALLNPEEGFAPPYSESYARALAIVVARAIVHRNDEPAAVVSPPPATGHPPVPPRLAAIVDEAAGKEHSATGPVMACLAQVLAEHRLMIQRETPADRAAVLREAADFYDQVLTDVGDATGNDPRYWNGVLDVATGLRRMAADVPAVGARRPDTETQAEPPTICWHLEILDGVWGNYGPIYNDRDEALARYRSDNEQRPTWKDPDRTPVQRRLVRETTTYTVEDAGVADETATEADEEPKEPHPTQADMDAALAVLASVQGRNPNASGPGVAVEEQHTDTTEETSRG